MLTLYRVHVPEEGHCAVILDVLVLVLLLLPVVSRRPVVAHILATHLPACSHNCHNNKGSYSFLWQRYSIVLAQIALKAISPLDQHSRVHNFYQMLIILI